MKKSLVSLSIAAMVLAGAANAEPHGKGTHKGHVHKSVGESCNDKCDDLRRQIEDLNASYQERLQALETAVEELEEVAHEHETLLLDPAEDSWTLGFDVWWADFSGAETSIANSFVGATAAGGLGVPAGGQFVGVINNNADDDVAWTASISFQDEVDSAWGFRYTTADSNSAIAANSGSAGLTVGAVGAPVNFFVPNGVAGAGAGIAGFTGIATDIFATRSIDIDDWAVEKESRVWANEKFAVNWSWGIRHADVDDASTVTYIDNSTQVAGGGSTTTQSRASRFDGWGPTAGMRARYYLSDDFEVQGNFGMAALVGENDFAVNQVSDLPFDGIPAQQEILAAQTTNNVNPVLDLGSRFVWHAGDDLDVHVGYSVTRYFDAVTTNTGGGVILRDDISLEGIRAGIQWNFD